MLAAAATKPTEAAHLSIVVLPFTNLSGDPAQDYFADGITENLTTELSRIRDSFVIARNTAFTYKGKSVDAKEIGKELGVRYVLEGSVQRDQNRVRVNAQLIDAESGAHLWADRFEEDVADLFKLQDEVVARLANSLGWALTKAEAEKGARSKNPDAIDLTMRGWTCELAASRTPQRSSATAFDEARVLFDRALQIDPNDADALAEAPRPTFSTFSIGGATPGPITTPKCLGRPIARSISPPTIPTRTRQRPSIWSCRVGPAKPSASPTPGSPSIRISPSLYRRAPSPKIPSAASNRRRPTSTQAMRLSPRDPCLGLWPLDLGDAELGLGHFDAAIDDYRKALDLGCRQHSLLTSSLAAAYAQAGQDGRGEEPPWRKPAASVPRSRQMDASTAAPNIPALFDGVRKAGLPEDAPAEPAHLSIVVLPFTNLSNDPARITSPTGSLRTSRPTCRASPTASSSPATPPSPTRAKASTRRKSARSWASATCLRARCSAMEPVSASTRSSSTPKSGAYLLADRFDEDVADLFKLQDEVVTRLARSLDFALTKAEAEKAGRSKNPDAIDLIMRGDDLFNRGIDSQSKNLEARALFERALQIDPNDAEALAGSAQTYVFDWNNGWGDPGTDYDAKILGAANRAIDLAPDDPGVYFPKARYLGLSRRPSEALGAADAGLAINPNDVFLLIARAIAENSLGRYEQAKADMERAMRLSPRDPFVGVFHVDLGEAEIGLGHFDAAIDEFRKAIDLGYRPFFAYTNLAAAYAHAGRMDEAKAALAEARRLNPAITIKWLKEHTPNLPASFDGLRKAGLPEE